MCSSCTSSVRTVHFIPLARAQQLPVAPSLDLLPRLTTRLTLSQLSGLLLSVHRKMSASLVARRLTFLSLEQLAFVLGLIAHCQQVSPPLLPRLSK